MLNGVEINGNYATLPRLTEGMEGSYGRECMDDGCEAGHPLGEKHEGGWESAKEQRKVHDQWRSG
jgi:hypothetical protein